MTLPSSRRPVEVEELLRRELTEECNEEKRSNITLRLDLKQIFMTSMVAWYKKLNESQRKSLTRKQVIKRAIAISYNLSFPYDKLPSNWLRVLHDKHGVIFKLSSSSSSKSRNGPKYNSSMTTEESDENSSPSPTTTIPMRKNLMDGHGGRWTISIDKLPSPLSKIQAQGRRRK